MQKFAKHPARSSQMEGKAFIRVSEESVDEDGVVTTKAGFIQVLEDKADSLIAKLQDGERSATLGLKLNTGLYEVAVGAAVTNAIEA